LAATAETTGTVAKGEERTNKAGLCKTVKPLKRYPQLHRLPDHGFNQPNSPLIDQYAGLLWSALAASRRV